MKSIEERKKIRADTYANGGHKVKDNSGFANKIKLRKYFLDKIEDPIILDVYGSYGMIYRNLYKDRGEYFEYKDGLDITKFNYIDLDAYSDPSTYILDFLPKVKNKTAIVMTDCAMYSSLSQKVPSKFKCLELGEVKGKYVFRNFVNLWCRVFEKHGKVENFIWVKNKGFTYYFGLFFMPSVKS